MPNQSSATLDTKSSVTSGRHLSKFEKKQPKYLPANWTGNDVIIYHIMRETAFDAGDSMPIVVSTTLPEPSSTPPRGPSPDQLPEDDVFWPALAFSSYRFRSADEARTCAQEVERSKATGGRVAMSDSSAHRGNVRSNPFSFFGHLFVFTIQI